ncbi:universal stress protein [Cellulosimicrobium sp. Marseille-Q4280]|jgi:nucleotide-binding universal stress UspA family protein|uniref:universal stress protein n=1 Tax=Cellulosimicrobium sp. Marseille-Q4280 TaxID=2937992 RepID=UPI00203CF620|nr:universal stress protein [Cellulosimicrobium sp. Marseille-Q4280]
MTVLVAYNDSPQGEAALHAAIAEAERRGAPLAVLVLTPQDPEAGVPAGLAHQLDALPAGIERPEVTYRSEHVDPADAIVEEAERTHPELVVIGARKRSPVGKFLLGSTTQRVLLDSPAPVLVIKARH